MTHAKTSTINEGPNYTDVLEFEDCGNNYTVIKLSTNYLDQLHTIIMAISSEMIMHLADEIINYDMPKKERADLVRDFNARLKVREGNEVEFLEFFNANLSAFLQERARISLEERAGK